jgi:hypothetical protein
MLVDFREEQRRVRLSLKGHEILEKLQVAENAAKEAGGDALQKLEAIWRPEYGRFMIEVRISSLVS